MFSDSSHYHNYDWRDRVSDLLNSLKDLSEDQILDLGIPTLAFTIHLAPHAHWSEREATLNIFAKFQLTQEVVGALETCQHAASVKVHNCLNEITEEREKHEG